LDEVSTFSNSILLSRSMILTFSSTISFYEGNVTPIQLLVDLKTRGNETYHAVLEELEPLRKRDWLTRWNGTHVIPGKLSRVETEKSYTEPSSTVQGRCEFSSPGTESTKTFDRKSQLRRIETSSLMLVSLMIQYSV